MSSRRGKDFTLARASVSHEYTNTLHVHVVVCKTGKTGTRSLSLAGKDFLFEDLTNRRQTAELLPIYLFITAYCITSHLS